MEHTANIVRVHRPQLSQQELERRLENIRRAAAELVLAAARECPGDGSAVSRKDIPPGAE